MEVKGESGTERDRKKERKEKRFLREATAEKGVGNVRPVIS